METQKSILHAFCHHTAMTYPMSTRTQESESHASHLHTAMVALMSVETQRSNSHALHLHTSRTDPMNAKTQKPNRCEVPMVELVCTRSPSRCLSNRHKGPIVEVTQDGVKTHKSNGHATEMHPIDVHVELGITPHQLLLHFPLHFDLMQIVPRSLLLLNNAHQLEHVRELLLLLLVPPLD